MSVDLAEQITLYGFLSESEKDVRQIRYADAVPFITREADLKQTKKRVCANCKHLKHDDILRRYRCSVGHLIDVADWRMKYEVCDRWEKKE